MDKKKLKEDNEIEEEGQETEEVRTLKTQLEETENKYKRAFADYQNLERRVSDQRRELIQSANKQLLLRLLPVLDTLITAQQYAVGDDSLKVVVNQFLDVLKNEGVTKIETVGKTFDPLTMECIQTTEGEEDKVLQEVRVGYMLYDSVLRAAQVIVGANMSDNQEDK